jgi:hypothetical protein
MTTSQLTSPTKLPVEVRRTLDLITTVVMAFDRLTLWVDHPAPNIRISRIAPHCTKLEVRGCFSLPFHPVWQTEIRVFQPCRQALIELQHALGTRHRVRLGYAELALDWLVEDRDAAEVLYRFVLKYMRVPYIRHAVTFKEGTAYFARRAGSDLAKSARNIVLYADKPSKLWPARQLNSPCCHLEHRLQGVNMVAQYGLLSLADCIGFDHRAFWTEHLRLFRLPSKVELGRWLNSESADVSGTALAKRADRFLGQYFHNDVFILQNCWRENSDIASVVTPLANTPFIVT